MPILFRSVSSHMAIETSSPVLNLVTEAGLLPSGQVLLSRPFNGSRRKVVFEEAAAGVVETVNRRFKELWENPLLVFPQLRQFPQRFSPPQFGYPVGKNPPHKKAPQVSRLGQGPVSANSTLFRS